MMFFFAKQGFQADLQGDTQVWKTVFRHAYGTEDIFSRSSLEQHISKADKYLSCFALLQWGFAKN